MTNDVRLSFVHRPSSDSYSQLILDQLERANLFVVPLDDNRHWFRYHHLFAEVLAAHLRAEQPDQIPTLHRRGRPGVAHNRPPAQSNPPPQPAVKAPAPR